MAKRVGERKLKATPTNQIEGKLQPQAIELEQAVLGALLIDNESLSDAIDSLQAEYFYVPKHQKIFEAIVNLFNNTKPVDILTVSEELKRLEYFENIGGLAYISELTNNVASSSNTEFHARIIAEKFIKRSLINISRRISTDAFDDAVDIFDLLNNAEAELFTVTEGTLRKSYDKMSTLIKGALENIETLRNKEDGLSGIPSGFTNLDRVTSGWQQSDLVICAARPGMGKTAFALTMARNIAVEHNTPIGFFSLEMSSEQLVNRLIASEAELGASKLRKGDLADHEMVQLHEKIKHLSEAPIFIDDTPALTIFELRAKARRLVKNHGVKIIMIDYLQLMQAGGNSGNREQEISTISRSLKGIAKELKIPVIALSQVNRGVESRTGVGSKRPMLSDLRESGAIEQDADIVTFIYRPEYYKIYEWDNGDDSRGQGELIIAKHRNGSLKNVRLKFIGEFAKFSDLDYFEESDFDDNDNNSSMISMSSSMNQETNNDPF
ncbi:MAG: replicative DNA helicase [Flavobacteriales bacterium]|mgnify:FL=1|nr:replicative DNA helicase [Flavobacteriales bacterium]MDG1933300.1 replicative DNA helicase [Flavobacteriales bacterium]MDG2086614.1 replicative DNA helicase [Flavobacteriales bacterium]|tara:strand:+ start:4721 stop:6205 length:1485 start_codon:yes stop_codon:yes gene_type:complete